MSVYSSKEHSIWQRCWKQISSTFKTNRNSHIKIENYSIPKSFFFILYSLTFEAIINFLFRSQFKTLPKELNHVIYGGSIGFRRCKQSKTCWNFAPNDRKRPVTFSEPHRRWLIICECSTVFARQNVKTGKNDLNRILLTMNFRR